MMTAERKSPSPAKDTELRAIFSPPFSRKGKTLMLETERNGKSYGLLPPNLPSALRPLHRRSVIESALLSDRSPCHDSES